MILDSYELMKAEFDKYTWRMPGFTWRLEQDYHPKEPSFFQPFEVWLVIDLWTTDSYHPENRTPIKVTSRHMVPWHMTSEHFPHFLNGRCRQAVVHESDEWFEYEGEKIFNPHREGR